MKNYTTPRTLADAQFTQGYPIHPMPQPPTNAERVAGVLLAVVIGVLFALLIVHSLAGA